MSPDAKRDFEARWTLLERRARSFLSRKHVPVCDQEDLLQELAVRLLRMWDSIDQDRPLWPLTSTILLNLLRDRSRSAPRHDVVALIPDVEAPHDVERAGLARVELDRVRRAMDHLSSSHRSILMQELSWAGGSTASPADKMLRMRARRKLRSIMEKVSGLVVLRARRLVELGEKLFVLRDGAATASCVICLVLGIGSVVVTPSAMTPEAAAGPLRSPSPSGAALDGFLQPSGESGMTHSVQERIAEVRRAQEAARAQAASSSSSSEARRERQRKEKKTASSGQSGLLPGLPVQDGDGGVGLPSPGVVAPDPAAPEVSPPEPGDAPTVEPPTPPSPPPPPPPPVNVAPATDDVVDEVESLL